MGHSETDCRTVIEKVFLYIDGEIAGAECAEIEAHLEFCARCLHHYGFEREVKLLLIEPRGVRNTGHAGGERTAANDVWI